MTLRSWCLSTIQLETIDYYSWSQWLDYDPVMCLCLCLLDLWHWIHDMIQTCNFYIQVMRGKCRWHSQLCSNQGAWIPAWGICDRMSPAHDGSPSMFVHSEGWDENRWVLICHLQLLILTLMARCSPLIASCWSNSWSLFRRQAHLRHVYLFSCNLILPLLIYRDVKLLKVILCQQF